jgi:hypothetical protein
MSRSPNVKCFGGDSADARMLNPSNLRIEHGKSFYALKSIF